jgi:hypothetical protein
MSFEKRDINPTIEYYQAKKPKKILSERNKSIKYILFFKVAVFNFFS